MEFKIPETVDTRPRFKKFVGIKLTSIRLIPIIQEVTREKKMSDSTRWIPSVKIRQARNIKEPANRIVLV